MARFTLEEFTKQKPKLVYVAGNLVDAEYAEAMLSEKQIDYAINIESFAKQSFLGGTYPGVFFYVSEKDAEQSRECLKLQGFPDNVVLEEQEFETNGSE